MSDAVAQFAVVREEFASVLQPMDLRIKLQLNKFKIVQANGLRHPLGDFQICCELLEHLPDLLNAFETSIGQQQPVIRTRVGDRLTVDGLGIKKWTCRAQAMKFRNSCHHPAWHCDLESQNRSEER